MDKLIGSTISLEGLKVEKELSFGERNKEMIAERKKRTVYASKEEMDEILNDKELVARIAEGLEDIKHGRGIRVVF